MPNPTLICKAYEDSLRAVQAMKGKMSALATGQALLAAELSKADQELGGSNGPQATEGA